MPPDTDVLFLSFAERARHAVPARPQPNVRGDRGAAPSLRESKGSFSTGGSPLDVVDLRPPQGPHLWPRPLLGGPLTLVQGGMVMFKWQRMCCVSSYFIALRRNDRDPPGSRLLSLTYIQSHKGSSVGGELFHKPRGRPRDLCLPNVLDPQARPAP